MSKLNVNDLTKEQLAMAMNCKTPEELVELAKNSGIEITMEEAKAYLDELANMELDDAALEKIAGGGPHKCWTFR